MTAKPRKTPAKKTTAAPAPRRSMEDSPETAAMVDREDWAAEPPQLGAALAALVEALIVFCEHIATVHPTDVTRDRLAALVEAADRVIESVGDL